MDSTKQPSRGRPKGDPTVTTSFRVPKELFIAVKHAHGNTLNARITAFLSSLNPDNPN